MISNELIGTISVIQKRSPDKCQTLLRAFLQGIFKGSYSKDELIFVLLSGCTVTDSMLFQINSASAAIELMRYAALISCDDMPVITSLYWFVRAQGDAGGQGIRSDMLDPRVGLNKALDEIRDLHGKLQADPDVSSRVKLVPLSSVFHIPGYDKEDKTIKELEAYNKAQKEFFKKLVDKVTGSKDSWPQGYYIE